MCLGDECDAVCCTVMQCLAVCCNVILCLSDAFWCLTMSGLNRHTDPFMSCSMFWYVLKCLGMAHSCVESVLQRVAVWCIVSTSLRLIRVFEVMMIAHDDNEQSSSCIVLQWVAVSWHDMNSFRVMWPSKAGESYGQTNAKLYTCTIWFHVGSVKVKLSFVNVLL